MIKSNVLIFAISFSVSSFAYSQCYRDDICITLESDTSYYSVPCKDIEYAEITEHTGRDNSLDVAFNDNHNISNFIKQNNGKASYLYLLNYKFPKIYLDPRVTRNMSFSLPYKEAENAAKQVVSCIEYLDEQ